MGLLDQVIGNATAGTGGGNGGLQDIVMQLINNPQIGGLSGLAQAFQNGGLGEIVNSWIANGPNLPVSAEQLQSVMGSSPIGAIASQLGVSPDLAGKQLADLLPGLVDMLTPNGQLPQGGDLMAQGMHLLKGKLLG